MTVKKFTDDPKDDRYYVRLYNPNGGQYKKIVRGKRAAQQHHDEMRAKLARRSVAPSRERGKTVRELMTEILDAKATLKVNTRTTYGNSTRLHIYPALGDVRVVDLTYLMVSGFLERVERDAGREARRTAEALVRNLLKVAIRERIIDRSPLDGVPFKRRPPVRGVPYAPELADLVLVRDDIASQRVNVLPGEADMNAAMVDVLTGTGVRIGELLAIAPEEDIDLDRQTLRIERQLLYVPKEGFVFATPKAESIRTIPVPGFVLSAIATTQLRNGLREVTLPWEDPEASARQTHRLLFHSLRRPGQPCHPQTLQDRVSRVAERVGLPGSLHPHSYRHRYTTELDEAGVPQVVIDEVTGHQPSGSVTRTTYTHPTEKGRARARDAIAAAWARAQAECAERRDRDAERQAG